METVLVFKMAEDCSAGAWEFVEGKALSLPALALASAMLQDLVRANLHPTGPQIQSVDPVTMANMLRKNRR